MSAAAIAALIELASKLEPPIAAAIVALVHSIHNKKNRVKAAQKAQVVVDAEPYSTDLEN